MQKMISLAAQNFYISDRLRHTIMVIGWWNDPEFVDKFVMDLVSMCVKGVTLSF